MRSPARPPVPLRLAGCHRIDLGPAHRLHARHFAPTLENVTDRAYLIGGSTGLTLDRANPRSAALRVSRFR